MLKCDVLVIGAGPAGSTAAEILAKSSAKVIIVEKREKVGVPVQCAELIPPQIAKGLPEKIVSQRIEGMRVYSDSKVREKLLLSFTIDRAGFDQYLAEKAVSAGAELYLATEAVRTEDGKVFVRQRKRELEIEPDIIIGADGPKSVVRRWMGLPPQRSASAVQYRVRLNKGLEYAEIHFEGDALNGYFWVFPKKERANIGFGADGGRIRSRLNRFIESLREKGVFSEIEAETSGLVPIGGLAERLSFSKLSLVGDAAGLTHPITGAGIANAVNSARLLAELLIENRFSEYEEEMRLIFSPLERAAELRKREPLEKVWIF
jgi:geranylgeranyl reductase family protein